MRIDVEQLIKNNRVLAQFLHSYVGETDAHIKFTYNSPSTTSKMHIVNVFQKPVTFCSFNVTYMVNGIFYIELYDSNHYVGSMMFKGNEFTIEFNGNIVELSNFFEYNQINYLVRLIMSSFRTNDSDFYVFDNCAVVFFILEGYAIPNIIAFETEIIKTPTIIRRQGNNLIYVNYEISKKYKISFIIDEYSTIMNFNVSNLVSMSYFDVENIPVWMIESLVIATISS